MKRKKRIEKGIDSLGKQIEKHKEKLKKAKEKGNPYLTDYYEKEIGVLEDKRKERQAKIKSK